MNNHSSDLESILFVWFYLLFYKCWKCHILNLEIQIHVFWIVFEYKANGYYNDDESLVTMKVLRLCTAHEKIPILDDSDLRHGDGVWCW